MPAFRWTLLLSLFCLFLSSCERRGGTNSPSPPSQPGANQPAEPQLNCYLPHPVEFGKPFTVEGWLENPHCMVAQLFGDPARITVAMSSRNLAYLPPTG